MLLCRREHLSERLLPLSNAVEAFIDCRKPEFQGGSQIIARWSTVRAIALNKSQLIAQAGSFKMAALTKPSCDFVYVRQRN
jgi:hypothetical protein